MTGGPHEFNHDLKESLHPRITLVIVALFRATSDRVSGVYLLVDERLSEGIQMARAMPSFFPTISEANTVVREPVCSRRILVSDADPVLSIKTNATQGVITGNPSATPNRRCTRRHF